MTLQAILKYLLQFYKFKNCFKCNAPHKPPEGALHLKSKSQMSSVILTTDVL